MKAWLKAEIAGAVRRIAATDRLDTSTIAYLQGRHSALLSALLELNKEERDRVHAEP